MQSDVTSNRARCQKNTLSFRGGPGSRRLVKLPRDLSATSVVNALKRLGFQVVRQTGSHIWISYQVGQRGSPRNGALSLPGFRRNGPEHLKAGKNRSRALSD